MRESVPPEVRRDRIGYVAVQFAKTLDSAKLLGFISAIDTLTSTEFSTLNSRFLEQLIDTIHV